MFWRPILLVNGILLSVLGALMLVPIGADLAAGHRDWSVFALSGVLTLFFGMVLFLSNRGYKGEIKRRQAFLLTSTSYVSVSLFAALPLFMSELDLALVDAFFEAVSGLTTTGSTVITDLDNAPPGILLWRSLLNALGGIGIVVMGMAVLPMLRIGGMQLFRTESSETSEKMLPKVQQIASTILLIFVSLMLACMFCYWAAGMSPFNAFCHALTTIATGGFSPHDSSIGHYDSVAIELIAIVFMIAGSIPLMLFYQICNGKSSAIWRNSQVRFFMMVIAGVTLALTISLIWQNGYDLDQALRYALFSTVTIVTTTGYGAFDYTQWGGFAITLLFMLTVVGGCTGSTSGGIKIFRFQIFYKIARTHLKQLIQPYGVFMPQYEGKPIPETVLTSVMTFLLLFALSFLVLAVVLSGFGLGFLTSMSAAAQALANVGPGLGDVIGPTGTYAPLPEGAKWVLAMAMIMGRLELFTVMVLFMPSFWNR